MADKPRSKKRKAEVLQPEPLDEESMAMLAQMTPLIQQFFGRGGTPEHVTSLVTPAGLAVQKPALASVTWEAAAELFNLKRGASSFQNALNTRFEPLPVRLPPSVHRQLAKSAYAVIEMYGEPHEQSNEAARVRLMEPVRRTLPFYLTLIAMLVGDWRRGAVPWSPL
jgi:hypothetical protein